MKAFLNVSLSNPPKIGLRLAIIRHFKTAHKNCTLRSIPSSVSHAFREGSTSASFIQQFSNRESLTFIADLEIADEHSIRKQTTGNIFVI